MTTPVYGAPHGQAPARAHGGLGHATASYIGIAGSVLALIASFLPWIKVTDGDASETIKGTEGDGMLTLVAAIAAIVLFGVGVFMRKAVVAAAGALPGLVIVVLGIMNVTDTERLPKADIEDEGAPSDMVAELLKQFEFSAHFGLYVLLIGGLVATVGGVMAFLKGRSS